MKIHQIHQQFLLDLNSAVEDLAARDQADALASGYSPSEVQAEGVGAFDPSLLIKYLPAILDALSTLIKKFQSA